MKTSGMPMSNSSDESLKKAKESTKLLADIWQVQSDWMRKNGVVSAKWEGEMLVECILGPVVDASPGIVETPEQMQERHAKEQADAEYLRDFGAS